MRNAVNLVRNTASIGQARKKNIKAKTNYKLNPILSRELEQTVMY